MNMTKYEIIKKLGEDRYVEKMLKKMIRQDIEEADMKDLPQMIYLQLLEKEDELIESLYETKELEYYIRRMIKCYAFSHTGPWWQLIKKFSSKTCQYIDDYDEENNDTKDIIYGKDE